MLDSPDLARWTPTTTPAVWGLPRQTSDLRGDWAAVMAAHRGSTEPWQERACVLRIQQLAERQRAQHDALMAPIAAGFAALTRSVEAWAADVRRALGRPDPGQGELFPAPPRARPGHAGPARTARPPRTIGRTHTGRR